MAFFLLGAAIGAAVALLTAPASGERTRRLVRKGEEVADYLIDTGRELVEECEDLRERSGELVEDWAHELSGNIRALSEHTEQLQEKIETILRRARSGANR